MYMGSSAAAYLSVNVRQGQHSLQAATASRNSIHPTFHLQSTSMTMSNGDYVTVLYGDTMHELTMPHSEKCST